MADISEQELWSYDPTPHRSGNWLRFKCCIHGGKNKNLSYNPENGYYRCFKCQCSGFVKEKQKPRRDFNTSSRAITRSRPQKSVAPKMDINLLRKRDQQLRPWLKRVQDNLKPDSAHSIYLQKRGITFEAAKRFGIGASEQYGVNVPWPHYCPKRQRFIRQGAGRIVVPTYHYWKGEPLLINLYGRSLSDEPKNQRHDFLKGPKGTIGVDARDHEYVLICEGAFDCLSLMLCGYPAVAFSGLSVDWSFLPKRVIFAYDNDGGIGQRATQDQGLDALLRGHQVEYLDYNHLGQFKDWNQMLQRVGKINIEV